MSLALHFIGVVGLHLAWTAFYDDFTIITSPQLKNSSELAAASLFDLLGVIFAKDGDKCMEFSESFKTLGVMVDFSKSTDGRAYLGHIGKAAKKNCSICYRTFLLRAVLMPNLQNL